MATLLERLDSLPITRTHIVIAVLCIVGLSADLMEISVGGALSAVFSAPPYNMDATSLGRLLSAVFVGAILGTPLIGWAADRWGLKRTLVPTFVWLGITSLLAATKTDFAWLLALRFLSGLSLGAIPPVVNTLLTGIAPSRYRGLYVFWVGAVSFLAAPATIFLIRWLTPLQPLGVAGWRWPFVVAGLLSLAAGVGFALIPESPRWLVGKGRFAAAEAAYRRFDESEVTLSTVVAGDAGVASSCGGTARVSAALKRRFAVIASVYFLHPWANVGFTIVTGPILLQRGYDLSHTLLYVGVSTFGPTISTLVAGLFIDRVERRTSLIACIVVMFASAIAFFTATTPAWTLASLLSFGIAVGFTVPLMSTYTAEVFPTVVRAAAMSSAWAINRIASALIPLVVLPLLASGGDTSASRVIYVPLLLIFALLIVFGPRGASGQPVE